MTAQPIGTILADVLDGIAKDVRAKAEKADAARMGGEHSPIRGGGTEGKCSPTGGEETRPMEMERVPGRTPASAGSQLEACHVAFPRLVYAGIPTMGMRQAAGIKRTNPRRSAASLMLICR